MYILCISCASGPGERNGTERSGAVESVPTTGAGQGPYGQTQRKLYTMYNTDGHATTTGDSDYPQAPGAFLKARMHYESVGIVSDYAMCSVGCA